MLFPLVSSAITDFLPLFFLLLFSPKNSSFSGLHFKGYDIFKGFHFASTYLVGLLFSFVSIDFQYWAVIVVIKLGLVRLHLMQ